jgi:hypothetical protein
MSEKRKSTSSSAIQVKNREKTIDIKEKLDVISRFEKGERIVDICRKVKFVRTSVSTIHENADGIKENAKSVINFLCSKTTTVLSERTVQKLWM